jgi:hypothetical protein
MMNSQVYDYKEEILPAPYTDGLKRQKLGPKEEDETNAAKVSISHDLNLRMKHLTLAPSRYLVVCGAITYVG